MRPRRHLSDHAARCGIAVLLVLIFLVVPMTAARADRVTVFAAASLQEALSQTSDDFTAATGHEVALSLAGSSLLARQIDAGAPADLVVLANGDWMDWLAARDRLMAGSRFDLASNRLVLIAPGGKISPDTGIQIPDLTPDSDLLAPLGDGRLAVALTEAVPAGIYARQALTALGLWQDVSPRLAETENVRAALALVARQEAPLGITYRTDALAEPGVHVVADIADQHHDPIRYPVARIAGADRPAARALHRFLQGASAQATLAALGFVTLEREAP